MATLSRELSLNVSDAQNLNVQNLSVSNFTISGRNVRSGSRATIQTLVVATAHTLTVQQLSSGYIRFEGVAPASITFPTAALIVAAGYRLGDVIECMLFNNMAVSTTAFTVGVGNTADATALYTGVAAPLTLMTTKTARRVIFTVTNDASGAEATSVSSSF